MLFKGKLIGIIKHCKKITIPQKSFTYEFADAADFNLNEIVFFGNGIIYKMCRYQLDKFIVVCLIISLK